jgi:hypothetical protein
MRRLAQRERNGETAGRSEGHFVSARQLRPEGINRAVNVERVPDTIARMPIDQFGHIVETLRRIGNSNHPSGPSLRVMALC